MGNVRDVADILFVTTGFAHNKKWKSFIKTADFGVLDEAANLCIQDALGVW